MQSSNCILRPEALSMRHRHMTAKLSACHRSKALHSVKRILNRVLAEAFAGWKQHTRERQQEKQIIAEVAQLPMLNMARRSWSIWWEAYQQKVKLRSTAQRLMHGTAIRVLHHWRVCGLASSCSPCQSFFSSHNVSPRSQSSQAE